MFILVLALNDHFSYVLVANIHNKIAQKQLFHHRKLPTGWFMLETLKRWFTHQATDEGAAASCLPLVWLWLLTMLNNLDIVNAYV